MESITKQFKQMFKKIGGKGKSQSLLLIIGLVAIFLIFISGYINKDNSKTKQTEKNNEDYSTETYIKNTEQRLEQIVTSIKGAGKTKVLVMIETGKEYVYADDTKNKTETTKETASDNITSFDELVENESQHVIIQEGSGNYKALLVTEIEPRIKGVIIVCEGGGNTQIQERITQAVKTALDVSAKRIYVTEHL